MQLTSMKNLAIGRISAPATRSYGTDLLGLLELLHRDVYRILLAALIGLADQWVDFRRLRLAGSDS